MPDTAIVVVTHNRPSILKATLDSLSACVFPAAVGEVLVYENGDRDCGSAELCRQITLPSALRYFHHDVSAKARTLNRALCQTEAAFVVFFDDDIVVEHDCVSAYVDAAARYGSGHFFGGPHSADGVTPPPEWLRRHLPSSAYDVDLGDRERVLNGPRFLGFNWAAFRSDLFNAGGFPAYLGPGQPYECGGGEETFMQQRLLDRDAKAVYLPHARVRHRVQPGECSYEFALTRRRRMGIAVTLARHLERNIPPRLLPPRWLLRKTAELALRQAANTIAGRSRERSIGTTVSLLEMVGSLKGHLILHKYGLFEEALREASAQMNEFSVTDAAAPKRETDAEAA